MNNSSLRSVPTEAWAAVTALVTGGALIVKKLLGRREVQKPDYVTRVEFHHEMTGLRDRMEAGHLAVTEKLEANQKEVLAELERHARGVERRLDRLESGLARVDERTKL